MTTDNKRQWLRKKGEEILIKEMAEYLSGCPYLDKAGIKINYLEGKPLAFSLKMLPVEPVVKRYADGGAVCEAQFLLSFRQEYSRAEAGNRAAAELCENVEAWICDQNNKGMLPDLGQEATPLSLAVAKSFGITPSGGIDARFEATLRLNYFARYVG